MPDAGVVTVEVEGLEGRIGDHDGITIAFHDARHPQGRDSFDDLATAVERVNALAEDWDPEWESPPWANPPERSPAAVGPHLALNTTEEDGSLNVRWAQALAADLTSAGWSGRLIEAPESCPPPLAPGDQPVVAVDLSPLGGRPGAPYQGPWHGVPTVADQFAELVRAWVAPASERCWLRTLGTFEVDFREGVRLLAATLGDTAKVTSVPPRLHGVSGSGVVRRADLDLSGRVSLVDVAPGSPADRLTGIREVLVAWAERCHHIGVAGDPGDVYPYGRVELGRRAPANEGSVQPVVHLQDRSYEATKVLDAYVMQVLNGAHLAATRGLSQWTVEPVGVDRFLVTHPDPEAWFLPGPDGERGTRVDTLTLAEARADLGDAILTAADVTR